jgi:hypothetical protein
MAGTMTLMAMRLCIIMTTATRVILAKESGSTMRMCVRRCGIFKSRMSRVRAKMPFTTKSHAVQADVEHPQKHSVYDENFGGKAAHEQE